MPSLAGHNRRQVTMKFAFEETNQNLLMLLNNQEMASLKIISQQGLLEVGQDRLDKQDAFHLLIWLWPHSVRTSVMRTFDQQRAEQTMQRIASVVSSMIILCQWKPLQTSLMLLSEMLQLFPQIRDFGWTAAHVAAALGHVQAFVRSFPLSVHPKSSIVDTVNLGSQEKVTFIADTPDQQTPSTAIVQTDQPTLPGQPKLSTKESSSLGSSVITKLRGSGPAFEQARRLFSFSKKFMKRGRKSTLKIGPSGSVAEFDSDQLMGITWESTSKPIMLGSVGSEPYTNNPIMNAPNVTDIIILPNPNRATRVEMESFYARLVRQQIDTQSRYSRLNPIMLSVLFNQVEVFQTLVDQTRRLAARDANGNNLLHYISWRLNAPELIRITLLNIAPAFLIRLLAHRNRFGCSPLHVGCFRRNFNFLYAIFRLELPLKLFIISRPSVTDEGFFEEEASDFQSLPESSSIGSKCTCQSPTGKSTPTAGGLCIKCGNLTDHLCQSSISQASAHKSIKLSEKTLNTFINEELARGGCPLHWTCSSSVLAELLLTGFLSFTNCGNVHGEQPMHVAVRHRMWSCAVTLFCTGDGWDMRPDCLGETPLHLAVRERLLRFVQLLLVYDSGLVINLRNQLGQTARHLAARHACQEDDEILYALHVVGAKRCRPCKLQLSDLKTGTQQQSVPQTKESQTILNIERNDQVTTAPKTKTTSKLPGKLGEFIEIPDEDYVGEEAKMINQLICQQQKKNTISMSSIDKFWELDRGTSRRRWMSSEVLMQHGERLVEMDQTHHKEQLPSGKSGGNIDIRETSTFNQSKRCCKASGTNFKNEKDRSNFHCFLCHKCVRCTNGCAMTGDFNGHQLTPIEPPDVHRWFSELQSNKMLTNFNEKPRVLWRCPLDATLSNKSPAVDRSASIKKAFQDSLENQSTRSQDEIFSQKVSGRDPTGPVQRRLLSVDGGGIRGLFSTQILIELEQRLKYPLREYFNWYGGTSTGSLVTTLLCLGYSLRDIRVIYFLIKNRVFAGSHTFDAIRYEAYLRRFAGERTLSGLRHCRLTITATLFDRKPLSLHLFRNYVSPEQLLKMSPLKANLGHLTTDLAPIDSLSRTKSNTTGAAFSDQISTQQSVKKVEEAKQTVAQTKEIQNFKSVKTSAPSEASSLLVHATTTDSLPEASLYSQSPKALLCQHSHTHTSSLEMTNDKQHNSPSQQQAQQQSNLSAAEDAALPSYTRIKLWHACRASSAAPRFFPPVGSFCDGGILSNNPTTDLLSELVLYNEIARSQHLPLEEEELLQLLVSVGTGRSEARQTKKFSFDFSLLQQHGLINPLCWYSTVQSCWKCINLLASACSTTDGHILSRMATSCSASNVPYVRLNALLSHEINTNEKDDLLLISSLWEVKAYFFEHRQLISQLIQALESSHQHSQPSFARSDRHLELLLDDIPSGSASLSETQYRSDKKQKPSQQDIDEKSTEQFLKLLLNEIDE